MSAYDINITQARAKAVKFHNVFPDATKRFTIPVAEIQEIIDQTGCTTITVHNGLDDENDPDTRTIIFYGSDSSDNRLSVLKGGAWTCPPNCSEGGDLES